MDNKEKKEGNEKKNKTESFKHLVRISGTVLDGNKDVARALTQIRGIGPQISKSLVRILGFEKGRKLGTLTDEEVDKIEKTINNLDKYIPNWALNRKKDNKTGKDIHLIGPDLDLAVREDINRLKRIKCYRGIRHSLGLPVRGQRTRTSFRKGTTVGVIRKKALRPASKSSSTKGGKGGGK